MKLLICLILFSTAALAETEYQRARRISTQRMGTYLCSEAYNPTAYATRRPKSYNCHGYVDRYYNLPPVKFVMDVCDHALQPQLHAQCLKKGIERLGRREIPAIYRFSEGEINHVERRCNPERTYFPTQATNQLSESAANCYLAYLRAKLDRKNIGPGDTIYARGTFGVNDDERGQTETLGTSGNVQIRRSLVRPE